MFRKSTKSRRGSGSCIADQLLHNAPESCEIKVVCEGKEVVDQMVETPSPSPSPTPVAASSPSSAVNNHRPSPMASMEENRSNGSVICLCFKSKFV